MKVGIDLQPKQCDLLNLVENSKASVIGVGGGRGAAKSSGADRVAISLMVAQKDCLACMVMRNADQVLRYHIEPIARDFPWVDERKDCQFKRSWPSKLTIGKAELDFSYGEDYDSIERRFRSANYRYIFIDQAEQFTEREIREIRKACRSRGKYKAKLILLFNMRGANIFTLRKWFRDKEMNKDEDPNDYVFLKVNPWDNVEWVRQSLEREGLQDTDYYAWTDEQRMEYASKRGDYTRQLATDDEAIRAADWYGGWDAIEGAYFASSFDLESTRASSLLVQSCAKPWATHWTSEDWGKSHFCVTYWHFRVTLKPSEAAELLGYSGRVSPLNLTVTYREMIVNERTEQEVAKMILECTPEHERKRCVAYFLSPECVTDDPNSIGDKQGQILRMGGMCYPSKADNDRKGGASLMDGLLRATKNKGYVIGDDGTRIEATDVWMISAECPYLLQSIPMAMRDPKNLDDILKTDKSSAKREQDVLEAARYGLKSMLSPRKQSAEERAEEDFLKTTDKTQRMMMLFRKEMTKVKKRFTSMPPSWRANVR